MTTILIVDDNRELRELVARDVRNQRHDVLVAEGYDQAVEILHGGAAVDVLVADLRMPDHDGLELIKRVREVSPATRAILISAFASARDYESALELGAIAVLCKPFTRAQLRTAIELAVECRTGFHGSIHGIGLTDLLQMLHLGQRSSAIVVGSNISGSIFMRQGEIIHAESGGLTGEKALARLLLCDSGSIQTVSLPAEVTVTMDRPFDALLLDLFRQQDEEANAGIFELDSDEMPEALRPVLAGFKRDEASLDRDDAPSHVLLVSRERERGWVLRGPPELAELVPSVLAACRLARTISGGAPAGTFEMTSSGAALALAWDDERDVLMALIEPAAGNAIAAAYFRARSASMARWVRSPDEAELQTGLAVS